MVDGISRTRAGRPHAVPGRPMLIHTYHAMSMPYPCRAHTALCCGLEKSFSEQLGLGMPWARRGMYESYTAALCKSNGKGTI
jgi:hypothetical protein